MADLHDKTTPELFEAIEAGLRLGIDGQHSACVWAAQSALIELARRQNLYNDLEYLGVVTGNNDTRRACEEVARGKRD